INGVVSFETFVHPAYQKRGVFTALVRRAEEVARSEGVDFMINFPNTNSLMGFLKSGWQSNIKPEYWIKGRNFLTIPVSINKLRSGFKPNISNRTNLDSSDGFEQLPQDGLTMIISKEYLEWRFSTYPVSEYIEV